MTSSTKNVKLGVCSVTFGGVDLGYTQGGVEVTVATETKKIMVDQFGNSEIDEVIMGRTCHAKVPLAETTVQNMVRIMPGATLVGTGAVAASDTITFSTAPPVSTDKVTINGVDFTYKTTPLTVNDMAIPGTINAAAAALAAAVNASIDPLVSEITAVAVGAVVTITSDNVGSDDNAIAVSKTFTTSANCTVATATLAGGTDATKYKVTVPNGIGTSLLSIAQKLVLHPIANLPTNRSEDFTMPIAATAGALNFAYKFDSERIFNVDFTAYPDSISKLLFVFGDESAT